MELPIANASYVTARPIGDVDAASAIALAEELELFLASGAGEVVIDLSGVGFMDSVGLRTLVRFLRRSIEDGWQLTLRSPRGQVRRLLERTNLLALFNVEDD